MSKIKVGDLVRVLIVGVDGFYTVDDIKDGIYKISQPYSGMGTRGHYSSGGSYKHQLNVPIEKIKKA
ncbi:MAG: hypothetical protein CBB68_12100 [Rhodospirillaceae bacterium TMED8]|nr:MAG: hypothetical protein CBB68_12100 [Rhodospirillaceae bacterium TMED8]